MAWMYIREGLTGNEPIGPLTDDAIASHVSQGRVKRTTAVAHPSHTAGQWVNAEESGPLAKAFAKLDAAAEAKRQADAQEKLERAAAKRERAASDARQLAAFRFQQTQRPAPPVEIRCPYCNQTLAIPYESLGTDIQCCFCSRAFLSARPIVAASSASFAGGQDRPHGAILPCVVISLVGSCLGTVAWLFMCFPIAIVPFSLAITEIVFLARIGSMGRQAAHSYARTLGIFEIIAGVVTLLNLFNIICGIMNLVCASSD